MGLDISAYRQIAPTTDVELDEYGEPVEWERFWRPGASMTWSESIWPGRAEGVPDADLFYSFAERTSFRAGSYSGYGQWRDCLRRLAAAIGDSATFLELTEFADNEGVIGPVVSAKLLSDFRANRERAALFAADLADDYGEYWLQKYDAWTAAFELAADSGAIDFH